MYSIGFVALNFQCNTKGRFRFWSDTHQGVNLIPEINSRDLAPARCCRFNTRLFAVTGLCLLTGKFSSNLTMTSLGNCTDCEPWYWLEFLTDQVPIGEEYWPMIGHMHFMIGVTVHSPMENIARIYEHLKGFNWINGNTCYTSEPLFWNFSFDLWSSTYQLLLDHMVQDH